MKLIKILILLLILFYLGISPGIAGTAQEEDVRVRESVSVVNVEVPVRVFYRGKPVNDLTRDDFELYEGRKQQRINGFFIQKQRIKTREQAGDISRPAPLKPRYFVLIFRIHDYNDDVSRALDYAFKNILRESDQLLVFANDRSVAFNNLKDKPRAQELVDGLVKEQARLCRSRMYHFLKRIERETYEYYQIWLQHRGSMSALYDLLNTHLQIWKEFKRRYIVPDMDKYFHFARHLEKIKKEKWVVNFYQVPMFPKIKNQGKVRKEVLAATENWRTITAEGKVIQRLMDEMEEEMNVAAAFPVKDISKLFYKVNATFHSIFINLSMADFSADYEFKGIATDIENSLRVITEKTGGSLVASNNLEEALGEIEVRESTCYMLTYAPENPEKKDKIRVKVKRKGHEIIFDDNMRADYINHYLERMSAATPSIRMDSMNLENKKLSLVISNYFLQSGSGTAKGKINLRIRVKDSRSQVLFDKNRTMVPQKETVNVSIPMAWLKKGEYSIIADVRDLVTGKSEMRLLQPTVL